MKLNTFWQKLTHNAPDNPGNGGTPPADDPPADPPADAPAAPDYGWMPEEFRSGDAPDLDGFKNHYAELIADKARRDEADSAVPETYDFTLPDDFDLGVEIPEGVEFKIDPENPLLGDFTEFLKENHVTQPVAQGLMGLLTKYQAQQYSQQHAAATKEFETLGATDAARDARVSTVQRAIETRLPQDQAAALMGAISSAAGVRALETILKPRGPATPNPAPGGADWDNLSPMERLKRANELNMQSQGA